MINENAIKIENLTFSYDSFNTILEDINLSISVKDFVGIIGPNGGGKSTLLKIILGIIKPKSGTVKVLGKNAKFSKGQVGYVSQFTGFCKKFPISVKDIVLMGRLARTENLCYKYSKEDKQIADNLMNEFGIYQLKDRQIGSLSGGQLQKTLFARALAMQPEILILDEPTSGVDISSKEQIYQKLNEINKKITIIMVAHDIGMICSYVKEIACLNRKLYYHGQPELTNELIKDVYGCPVDIITHGKIPHRVLAQHE